MERCSCDAQSCKGSPHGYSVCRTQDGFGFGEVVDFVGGLDLYVDWEGNAMVKFFGEFRRLAGVEPCSFPSFYWI